MGHTKNRESRCDGWQLWLVPALFCARKSCPVCEVLSHHVPHRSVYIHEINRPDGSISYLWRDAPRPWSVDHRLAATLALPQNCTLTRAYTGTVGVPKLPDLHTSNSVLIMVAVHITEFNCTTTVIQDYLQIVHSCTSTGTDCKVFLLQLKHRLGHSERWSFLLYEIVCIESKYPDKQICLNSKALMLHSPRITFLTHPHRSFVFDWYIVTSASVFIIKQNIFRILWSRKLLIKWCKLINFNSPARVSFFFADTLLHLLETSIYFLPDNW